jgi:hypothetical protein
MGQSGRKWKYAKMGMFAETANVDYRLSFANQG